MNTQNVQSEDLFTSQDLIPEPKAATPDRENEDLTEDLVPNSNDVDMALIEGNEDIAEAEEEEVEENNEETETVNVDPMEASELNTIKSQDTHELPKIAFTSADPEENSKAKTVPKPSVVRITELPLSKVAHIIKLDPDVKLVNSKLQYFPFQLTPN